MQTEEDKLDDRKCYGCVKKGHHVWNFPNMTDNDKAKVYKENPYAPPDGWTAPAALAAAMPAAKTPWKARMAAATRMETGLVNILVDDNNNNNTALIIFAKFQEWTSHLELMVYWM